MKQLHPTELYAIEVPKDAKLIKIVRSKLKYFTHKTGHIKVELPNSDLEILGEVTAGEISFDVEIHLNKDEETNSFPFFENREGKNAICFDKEKSFRSLLSANGLYFENKIRKPKADDYDYYEYYLTNLFEQDFSRWAEFENNLIKGKLIILKKIF